MADAKYAPQTVAEIAGVSADDIRSAARLYATGGNAAIYYGLGVTEHTQGSTGVMALANLAMVTGNFGRMGVGVSPMRGQNNVQGACDMGCFPDVFPGYRSVADDEIRGTFEQAWGVELDDTPGICIPSMIDASASGAMKGLYVQGEDIAQSDPNIAHVEKALSELDCLIVQDLFLNQTANFAHVFLPGASFLEKDGTFINAERRITRINKILPPASGLSDWQITQVLSNAMGYQMSYRNASVIMDEIAQLTPTFAGVSYARIDALGSLQWPCNEAAPEGTEIMHVGQFTRGLGKFMDTTFTPSPEEVTADFPLRLTTGRILTQYNSGVQTRRTDNVVWHEEDKLEINAADAEVRNIHDDDLVAITSRSGTTSLRARVTPRVPPGVVYTTFHHPETGLNVITSDYRDWMTECPEYKFTAVQVERTERPSDWQADHEETERRGHRIAHAEGEPS